MSAFLKATLTRAVRTVAQTVLAMVPVTAAMADVDWGVVAVSALGAGALSVLTSIATGLPEAPKS
jgi:hypothetical protein